MSVDLFGLGSLFGVAADKDETNSLATTEPESDTRSVNTSLCLENNDDTIEGEATDENEIAKLINGQCMYENGEPAFVPAGQCVSHVPPNFVDVCKGNVDKAHEMWTAHQKWRRESNAWNILSLPQPWFTVVKDYYPHALHGYSKSGIPVMYENPGKMRLVELFKKEKDCDVGDLVRLAMFSNEYIANMVWTRDEIQRQQHQPVDGNGTATTPWKMLVVMDFKDIGFGAFSRDVVRYLGEASDMVSKQYPNIISHNILINAPGVLASVYMGLKNILPETMPVDLVSENDTPAVLRKWIDQDQLPVEYGGQSPYALGEHPYELERMELARKLTEQD